MPSIVSAAPIKTIVPVTNILVTGSQLDVVDVLGIPMLLCCRLTSSATATDGEIVSCLLTEVNVPAGNSGKLKFTPLIKKTGYVQAAYGAVKQGEQCPAKWVTVANIGKWTFGDALAHPVQGPIIVASFALFFFILCWFYQQQQKQAMIQSIAGRK